MNYLREIGFLCNVFIIVFTELFIYFVFRDKLSFIDRLTQRLANINILYVKVFQAFALNNHLIDPQLNNMLLQFTDNAPWTNNDIDYKTLFQLEDNERLQFTELYPSNAGMISLVFRAKNKCDNTSVVVKIKRQNIEAKLTQAIDNLLFFMYILSFFPIVQKYQLNETIQKNIDIIKHQVDFHEEVQNILLMKKNCKYLKYVKIPDVYPSITDKYNNVILMEEIQGIPIHQVREEDYEEFAKQVIKFGLVTTLIHGVAHGDLHGGNILFIKNEHDSKYKHKIGVFDFGIIYKLDSQYKLSLFDLITEMFNTPAKESAEKILLSGLIEPVDLLKSLPATHYNNLLKMLTEIVHETIHVSKQANQIQIYKFMSQFKTYISNPEISELGFKPSDSLVKTQLVLAMAHGVTLTLCKDDYMTLADKVINELFPTNMIM